MEEIASTEELRKEIFEDARRKAERLLQEADEEAGRLARSGEEASAKALDEIARGLGARIERLRAEADARIPLEKNRLKAAYVDERIRLALAAFIAALPEERVGALSAAALRRAAPILTGRELRIRYKGIGGRSAARIVAELFPGTSEPVEDAALPSRGMAVSAADGSLDFAATMDLVAEDLASRCRGELARALCAEALSL
jgi:V/A-type H+-transporting ATPase subunit E